MLVFDSVGLGLNLLGMFIFKFAPLLRIRWV